MSRRKERLASRLKEQISHISMYELADPRMGFVTITGVKLSDDMKYATVRVSVMGNEETQQETLKTLAGARGYIQRLINERVPMRQTPILRFRQDEGVKHSVRMSALLRELAAEREARESETQAAPSETAGGAGEVDKEQLEEGSPTVNVSIGLPIGSLQEATIRLLDRAGFKVYVERRSYYPVTDDEELAARLIRPQDMSRFVEKGIVDCGLTGRDWIEENGSAVHVVADLVYAKQRMTPVRWVLAVPEDSDIETVEDLEGKHIATELVEVTRNYFAERGINATVEFSHGATEAKAPDIVDAIVDVTETGSSLRANRMRIVATIMESNTQLIANRQAWEDAARRAKIEGIAMLLRGAIDADDKVGLKMNVAADRLEGVLAQVPALRRPTVSTLADEAGYAVETIVDESIVRRIIPELKKAGAEGIVEYPLNKIIP